MDEALSCKNGGFQFMGNVGNKLSSKSIVSLERLDFLVFRQCVFIDGAVDFAKRKEGRCLIGFLNGFAEILLLDFLQYRIDVVDFPKDKKLQREVQEDEDRNEGDPPYRPD